MHLTDPSLKRKPLKAIQGEEMKTLLIISDIHGSLGAISRLRKALLQTKVRPECIIVAGDLTHFGDYDQAKEIIKLLRELGSSDIVYVPGNCDPPSLLNREIQGAHLIHLRPYMSNDLIFIGIGGGGISPFNTYIEFTEEEFEYLTNKLLHLVKKRRDHVVLVTHQPPYMTSLDIVYSGEHIGSKSIRRLIQALRPLLHVCGHVHEARGIERLNSTHSINPGPLRKGYYAIARVSLDKQIVELSLKRC
ncbi:MAG: hypothetical protein DRN15_07030 [Thermoprotei archaeon]|nr:MAG: hypothetical protein DRM97_07545 [Thermoprotei archaeon]RLF23202.1 MAG: hypothetical protein DRN15_07030 [Thermoprotei archaeon]